MIGRTSPLLAQIAKLEREMADLKSTNAKVFGANLRMARELTAANAKLAVFTAPRNRAPDGKFLPVQERAA